jgi:hypothetical protein
LSQRNDEMILSREPLLWADLINLSDGSPSVIVWKHADHHDLLTFRCQVSHLLTPLNWWAVSPHLYGWAINNLCRTSNYSSPCLKRNDLSLSVKRECRLSFLRSTFLISQRQSRGRFIHACVSSFLLIVISRRSIEEWSYRSEHKGIWPRRFVCGDEACDGTDPTRPKTK